MANTLLQVNYAIQHDEYGKLYIFEPKLAYRQYLSSAELNVSTIDRAAYMKQEVAYKFRQAIREIDEATVVFHDATYGSAAEHNTLVHSLRQQNTDMMMELMACKAALRHEKALRRNQLKRNRKKTRRNKHGH